MACKLYMKHNGQTVPLGTFKNQKKAIAFWELYLNGLKTNGGKYPQMILVESKKGRGKEWRNPQQ